MKRASNTSRKMGMTMFILAWVVLLALLAVFFDDRLQQQHNPNQLPMTNNRAGLKEVVLQPNRQHHYVVSGRINGHDITFLLDTGATDVVIPQRLAQQLGLKPGLKQYADTANGRVAVYSTRLSSVEIGNILLENVHASINPAMTDSVVLLGMSALRQVEFSQQGDSLILRQ
jgi:aspartyl protease family protein